MRTTPTTAVLPPRAGETQKVIVDPALQFPDRTVLYVHECAARLRVTQQHIIDLIEEGALAALDVGGDGGSVRVPPAFLRLVAEQWGRTEGEVQQLLEQVRLKHPRKRASWRIPVTGWTKFLERRNTLSHPN